MVIDTSAILAWLKEEPERSRIVAALEAHSTRRVSAVSLLEAQIVVRGREHPALLEKLERFLDEIEALVTPFDEKRITHCAYEMGVGDQAFVTSNPSDKTLVAAGTKIVFRPGSLAFCLLRNPWRCQTTASPSFPIKL